MPGLPVLAIGSTRREGTAADQHGHQFFALFQVRGGMGIEGLLALDLRPQGIGIRSQRELPLGAAHDQFHIPVAVSADGLGYKGDPALIRQGNGALLQQFGVQKLGGLGESLHRSLSKG